MTQDKQKNYEELEESAQRWDLLAMEQEVMRNHEFAMGNDISVFNNRIKLYRNTAKSLRLEMDTGEPHCACHLAPESQWGDLDRKR